MCRSYVYTRIYIFSCLFQTRIISDLVMEEVLPTTFVFLRMVSKFGGCVATALFPSERVEQNDVYAKKKLSHFMRSLLIFYENVSFHGEGKGMCTML